MRLLRHCTVSAWCSARCGLSLSLSLPLFLFLFLFLSLSFLGPRSRIASSCAQPKRLSRTRRDRPLSTLQSVPSESRRCCSTSVRNPLFPLGTSRGGTSPRTGGVRQCVPIELAGCQSQSRSADPVSALPQVLRTPGGISSHVSRMSDELGECRIDGQFLFIVIVNSVNPSHILTSTSY